MTASHCAGALPGECGRPLGGQLPVHGRGHAGAGAKLRLVKGSHIVVPRLFGHDSAYLLQQPDGRVVFAIPYEGAFTLVGTTDVDYQGDLDRSPSISEPKRITCARPSTAPLPQRIAPRDVVWSYAGVRPLIGDEGRGSASGASRDYRLETDRERRAAAVRLRRQGHDLPQAGRAGGGLDRAGPGPPGARLDRPRLPAGRRPVRPPAAARAVLEFEAWTRTRQQQYAGLPPELVARYARAYGTRLGAMLGHCRSRADLGEEIVPGLFEVEADWLVKQEWAQTADDILWRRTKLGLHLRAAGGTRGWTRGWRVTPRAAWTPGSLLSALPFCFSQASISGKPRRIRLDAVLDRRDRRIDVAARAWRQVGSGVALQLGDHRRIRGTAWPGARNSGCASWRRPAR
jgi:glycerol-3-phosphate dehydrogenase